MASSECAVGLICMFWLILLVVGTSSQALNISGIDKIYQLGDSLSDTGNLIYESTEGDSIRFTRLPYGENFYNTPTGRCSDGLLMIDYIAMAAGLPLLQPYKKVHADFRHGVNFAVAGATSLSAEVLKGKGIIVNATNSSLEVQLQWMETHFDSISPNPNRSTALFMVGEIGGNDYNDGLFDGKSTQELMPMVPEVVGIIIASLEKLIDLGATKLVVPGNFPIGCLPNYKKLFRSEDPEAYDENGCLKELNRFADIHNIQLKEGLERLKKENPDAVIVYGDYYNAYRYLLRIAKARGYDTESACCGIKASKTTELSCGDPDASVCSDPTRFVSWDGLHLTQEAYRILANWLLRDIFFFKPFLSF